LLPAGMCHTVIYMTFNTVKYALNTIRRIIQICRMTYPWLPARVGTLELQSLRARSDHRPLSFSRRDRAAARDRDGDAHRQKPLQRRGGGAFIWGATQTNSDSTHEPRLAPIPLSNKLRTKFFRRPYIVAATPARLLPIYI